MSDLNIIDGYKKIHEQELLTLHYSMFEYKNLPGTVDPLYIEQYLQNPEPDSYCGWWRLNESETSPGFPAGSLIVTPATLTTELNPYGEGSGVICITRNGHSRTFDRYGDEVVLGFNSILHTPCDDIKIDSLTLAEIDLSIMYLIRYTRLYPIFKAADEKTREKIITAFKNMELGVPLTIIDKPLLEDLGIESQSIQTETLTNPELSKTIQFTAKLREDIKRWHYTKYGQTINATTKLAQETVDEVNSSVSSSLIIPLSMLAARRKMIEEVNAKFGTDIQVDFSGAWRAEVTRYENNSGEPSIDGTEDQEEAAAENEEVTADEENETGRDPEESNAGESV